jgi:hypothetical protein
MITPTALSATLSNDTLLVNVPKLELDGSNWAIWLMRFEIAMKAKRKWQHFVGGSGPVPANT